MTGDRKHAILTAATILLARKLQPMLETEIENPIIEHYQWRAIHQASRLLDKIDQRWPAEAVSEPPPSAGALDSAGRQL